MEMAGFWDETADFCERRYHSLVVFSSFKTEAANTCTSLVISLIALWGLRQTYWCRGGTLLYGFLLWNGIASAAYHATGAFGFGLMDSLSMTLQLWLCTVLLLSVTVNTKRASCCIVLLLIPLLIVAVVLDATRYDSRSIFATTFFLTSGLLSWHVRTMTLPFRECWARSCFLVAIASFGWLADLYRCQPESDAWTHYVGHSVWHTGAGLAQLYFGMIVLACYNGCLELRWWPNDRCNPFRWILPLPKFHYSSEQTDIIEIL